MLHPYLILAIVAGFLVSHLGAFAYGRSYQGALDEVASLNSQIESHKREAAVLRNANDMADNQLKADARTENENDKTQPEIEDIAGRLAVAGVCVSADFMRALAALK